MFADLSRFLCAAPRSPRGEKLTSQHSAFGTWSIVIYTFRELIYVAPSSLYILLLLSSGQKNRNMQVKSEFMADFIMLVPRLAHR